MLDDVLYHARCETIRFRHLLVNVPISVFRPVPITTPRHLPAAMLVPYNTTVHTRSMSCFRLLKTGCSSCLDSRHVDPESDLYAWLPTHSRQSTTTGRYAEWSSRSSWYEYQQALYHPQPLRPRRPGQVLALWCAGLVQVCSVVRL